MLVAGGEAIADIDTLRPPIRAAGPGRIAADGVELLFQI